MYSSKKLAVSKTECVVLFLRGAVLRPIFTIYGHGGHLGHATKIMSSAFHFHVPESFHTKFGSDRHSSF